MNKDQQIKAIENILSSDINLSPMTKQALESIVETLQFFRGKQVKSEERARNLRRRGGEGEVMKKKKLSIKVICDCLEACYSANEHPYPMGLALLQAKRILEVKCRAKRK